METLNFKEVIFALEDGREYESVDGEQIQTKIYKQNGSIVIDFYKNGEIYVHETAGLIMRDCTQFIRLK